MKRKILVIIVLLLAAVLAALLGGGLWLKNTHVIIDRKPYARDAQVLDLQGRDISLEEYMQLRETMPQCRILWDIPFQNNRYPSDTEKLTVTGLTPDDVARLALFEQLEQIDATGCTDYALLLQVQEAYPRMDLRYSVTVDGAAYPQDTREITLTSLTEEEVALLGYLPQLQVVKAADSVDTDLLLALRQQNPQLTVCCSVTVGTQTYTEQTREITLTQEELSQIRQKLGLLAGLERVHLVEPEEDAAELLALREAYPQLEISWEKTLLGKTHTTADLEIDYSDVTVSMEEVEAAMAYYPDAQKVYFGFCELDYEQLAAYRDRVRGDYKVVWSMMLGKVPVRTDDVFFHPYQHEIYNVFDKDLVNFKYCEDMICVDLGHNSLYHCDWAEGMPNLKYLILAWNIYLEDISGLANCTELVYLELGWTQVRDFTPLLGCTKLEDIHLKYLYSDPGAIYQMTWLKNIFWEGCKPIYQEELKKSLPDTYILFGGENSQTKQWRQLDNYFAQRDVLGMPYMN